MIKISYSALIAAITALWLLVRAYVSVKQRKINWKREFQLVFVYICIIVVARFTFFPFGKVDGKIQPLVFDSANCFPFHINWIPFVYLFDYPKLSEILLNVIGNTAMFVPLGIVWPCVYRQLDTHGKVIAAGIGVSLTIEILQLPFFDRVSDIDDLILNTLGYVIGYLIFLAVRVIKNLIKNRKARKKASV